MSQRGSAPRLGCDSKMTRDGSSRATTGNEIVGVPAIVEEMPADQRRQEVLPSAVRIEADDGEAEQLHVGWPGGHSDSAGAAGVTRITGMTIDCSSPSGTGGSSMRSRPRSLPRPPPRPARPTSMLDAAIVAA